jgi:hypothetical protein
MESLWLDGQGNQGHKKNKGKVNEMRDNHYGFQTTYSGNPAWSFSI